MNPYIYLNRIEFPVTYHCTGKCRHCSVGEKNPSGVLNANQAAEAVKKLAGLYPIESVMCFGGEPLLYADTVCAVMRQAGDSGIERRQIITNGFFSKDHRKIGETAAALSEAGVNEILLSVDAFHQETVPIEPVHAFAAALKKEGIRFQLHPAWLVNEQDDNPYNRRTREVLDAFSDLDLLVSRGNRIFPAGNAAQYLAEYFPKEPFDLTVPCGKARYTEPLDQIRCLSIDPSGNVVACCIIIGNIYKEDISDIVNRYDPYQNELTKTLLDSGVPGLLKLAESKGIHINLEEHYSACGVCREIMNRLQDTL